MMEDNDDERFVFVRASRRVLARDCSAARPADAALKIMVVLVVRIRARALVIRVMFTLSMGKTIPVRLTGLGPDDDDGRCG